MTTTPRDEALRLARQIVSGAYVWAPGPAAAKLHACYAGILARELIEACEELRQWKRGTLASAGAAGSFAADLDTARGTAATLTAERDSLRAELAAREAQRDKEAERHERDHRAADEELEQTRAELAAAQAERDEAVKNWKDYVERTTATTAERDEARREVERMRGMHDRFRQAVRGAVTAVEARFPDLGQAYDVIVQYCRTAKSGCFCGAHISQLDALAAAESEVSK